MAVRLSGNGGVKFLLELQEPLVHFLRLLYCRAKSGISIVVGEVLLTKLVKHGGQAAFRAENNFFMIHVVSHCTLAALRHEDPNILLMSDSSLAYGFSTAGGFRIMGLR